MHSVISSKFLDKCVLAQPSRTKTGLCFIARLLAEAEEVVLNSYHNLKVEKSLNIFSFSQAFRRLPYFTSFLYTLYWLSHTLIASSASWAIRLPAILPSHVPCFDRYSLYRYIAVSCLPQTWPFPQQLSQTYGITAAWYFRVIRHSVTENLHFTHSFRA